LPLSGVSPHIDLMDVISPICGFHEKSPHSTKGPEMSDTTTTILVPPMLNGSTGWTEVPASAPLCTECPTVTWIVTTCANCREWYEFDDSALFCPVCVALYQ
jgi:hypothetical protein